MKKEKLVKSGSKAEIVRQFHQLAERIETGQLEETEIRIFLESVLPALDFFLKGQLDFFSVLAYGKMVMISDWLNTRDASLFDISGRVHLLSSLLGDMAMQQEVEQHGDECEDPELTQHVDTRDSN